MNTILNRIFAHWRTTAAGLLMAVVAVCEAIQKVGHDPVAITIAAAPALLGLLAKD